MRDKNLWFAPATPSEGSAYVALYHALAAFDAGMPRRSAPAISRTIDNGDRVETIRPPMFQLDEDASPSADHADPEGAERLLAALLADPVQAKRPSLWRQAAGVAEQRRQYDLARQRLEHALQLEAKKPRDLAALRRDYAWLLRLAHQRVKELTSQHRATSSDLLDRVMAVADHWRTVDPVDWIPCHLAARILGLAGERELAWSYLTTPAALHGATAASWLEVARQQHGQHDYDLAERAFAAASSLNPDDPSIVRERAGNLRAAGRNKAARELLKRIEQPDW
jgi:tetratricopeptide (TPR) repeat protein